GSSLRGFKGEGGQGRAATHPGVRRMPPTPSPLNPPNIPSAPNHRVHLGRRDAMRAGRSAMFTERMSRENVNATVPPPELSPAPATDTVVWDVQVTSKLLSTGLHEGKILWPDTTLTPVEWTEPEGWISSPGSG